MAAAWGSGASAPVFPLRNQYNGAELHVDVPLAASSGSGGVPQITFALYQVVTSPGTAANYTEICHSTLGLSSVAGTTSSFQTLGCAGGMTSTNASVFLVVYRSDVNNFATVTNLVFEADAQFSYPS